MQSLRFPVLAALALLFVQDAIAINYKPDHKNPPLTPLHTRRASWQEAEQHKKAATNLRQTDVEQYACTNCLASINGTARVIRALYLESLYTVENPVADEAADAAGMEYPCRACCSEPERARPECYVAENWNKGWVAAPVNEVFQNLGAKVVALTPANYSANTEAPAAGSIYERCIWEVFYGQMDICVGSFWETSARRSMILFTTPLDINAFVLVTTARQSKEFKALSMFDPFSGGVWGVMGGMFMFTACIMWIVQSQEAETDFDDDEVFPYPKGLAKAFWLALMGYFAGPDPKYVTTSWSGRIIILGFGFFLYTSVMSYTANLASFMVLKDSQAGEVGSLKDLVDRGEKICANMDMEGMITQPGLDAESRLLSNHFGAILEGLVRGDCKAAVVGKYEWRVFVTGSNAQYVFCNDTRDDNYFQGYFCFDEESELAEVDLANPKCMDTSIVDINSCPEDQKDYSDVHKFCNVIRLEDRAFDASLNVAFPVAHDLEPYISAWLVKLRQDGSINRFLSSEIWDRNPPNCPADTAQGQTESSRANALGLESMAGTYIICAIFMGIGCIMHGFDKYAQYRERANAPIQNTEANSNGDPNSRTNGLQKEVSTIGELPSASNDRVTAWRSGRSGQDSKNSFGSSNRSDRPHLRMGAYTGGKPHLRGDGQDSFRASANFKGHQIRGMGTSFKEHDAVVDLETHVAKDMGKLGGEVHTLKSDVHSLKSDMHSVATQVKDLAHVLKQMSGLQPRAEEAGQSQLMPSDNGDVVMIGC